MSKLNEKQQQFVERYLVCLNATQAYKEVYGVSDKVAGTNGPRLLENAGIKAAIEKEQKQISKRNHIDQDWVVQRLIAVADGHIGRVATFKGTTFTLKDSAELTEEDLRCLSSIKRKERSTAQGNEFEFQLTLRDNVKALELLGKHIGMWGDKDGGDDRKRNNQSVRARILELADKFRTTGKV